VLGFFSTSLLASDISENYPENNLKVRQQQIEISGNVTDAQTGDPLPGVNIVVQGTTMGTTSDMDGYYSIEAPSDATLVIRSLIKLTF
jgi:hypothetical protein